MNDTKVIDAFHMLRVQGYGRDSWYSFEEGRTIVNNYLGDLKLVEQIINIERVSKSGKCKSLVGNTCSTKGGKLRKLDAKCSPTMPDELKDKVLFYFPPHWHTRRTEWLRSPLANMLCEELPEHHPGLIFKWIQTLGKKARITKKCVYFARDPLRPNDYNIGTTKHDPETRFADAGSKGRYWVIETTLNNVPETEVHKLVKPWQDHSGRGAETFVLDTEARQLLKDTYGVVVP